MTNKLSAAVVGSVTRLEGFIKLVAEHVMMRKLGSNCSFQDLAEARKVGDRPVVVEVIGGPNQAFWGLGLGMGF